MSVNSVAASVRGDLAMDVEEALKGLTANITDNKKAAVWMEKLTTASAQHNTMKEGARKKEEFDKSVVG